MGILAPVYGFMDMFRRIRDPNDETKLHPDMPADALIVEWRTLSNEELLERAAVISNTVLVAALYKVLADKGVVTNAELAAAVGDDPGAFIDEAKADLDAAITKTL